MPIGLTAATVGAGVLGAGASIYGANKAAGAASNAAAQNNALQEEIYNSNKGLLSPFIGYGTQAGGTLAALLGLGGDTDAANKAFDAYKNSTGYDFTMKSGTDAINANAATRGLLNSGANLKALNTYGQQTGQQYFNNYLNSLQGQEQIGMSGASALAGVGQGYANAVSANNNSAASAMGNAYLAGSGSINSLLGNLTGAYALNRGLSSYGSSSNIGAGLSDQLNNISIAYTPGQTLGN